MNNKKFDVITCHFAIHYMYNTIVDFKQNMIDSNLSDKGVFLYTYLNLYKNLNDGESIYYYGNDKKLVTYNKLNENRVKVKMNVWGDKFIEEEMINNTKINIGEPFADNIFMNTDRIKYFGKPSGNKLKEYEYMNLTKMNYYSKSGIIICDRFYKDFVQKLPKYSKNLIIKKEKYDDEEKIKEPIVEKPKVEKKEKKEFEKNINKIKNKIKDPNNKDKVPKYISFLKQDKKKYIQLYNENTKLKKKYDDLITKLQSS